jgi:hypothetical protein
MPKVYLVELNELARARTLAPRLHERLEIVCLSDLGRRVLQIAQALGAHEHGVTPVWWRG